MNKSLAILVVILVIIGIGIIIFGSVMFTYASNSYNSGYDSNYKSSNNNLDYGYPSNYKYSNVLPHENPCYGSSSIECFNYPTVPQKKLEPCPPPRPVCPLCNKHLEQEKGYGHMDVPQQTKINC